MTEHGAGSTYFWLPRRPKEANPGCPDPGGADYLAAENDYIDETGAHGGLQELFDEIVGRIKKDDRSVPVRNREHWYTRYEEGKSTTAATGGEEVRTRTARCREVLLDQNVLRKASTTSLWAAWASAMTTASWPLAWTR